MPAGERLPATLMDEAQLRELLAAGELAIEGRLVSASNTTLACVASEGDVQVRCVYKPVRGERPLWDFPTDTLGLREVAASAVDTVLGWGLVPPTVWREDGPYGPGMCQLWIEHDEDHSVVDIVPAGRTPRGWLRVLEATDGQGRAVSLVHRDRSDLQRIALLDILINNADRKGGHVLVDPADRLWAIDHGVTFSDEPKLRTVLWGWAGEPFSEDLDSALADVQRLSQRLGGMPELAFLDAAEEMALRERIDWLLADRTFPSPSGGWPSVPWPVF